MRAVIIFVYLCFLLLKGYDTYTGILSGLSYTPAHHIGNTHHVKQTGSKEDECLFNEEVEEEEDDDESHTAAKKYHPLSRYASIPSHTFILNHLYGCFKDRLSYNGSLSYKYITQRALRI